MPEPQTLHDPSKFLERQYSLLIIGLTSNNIHVLVVPCHTFWSSKDDKAYILVTNNGRAPEAGSYAARINLQRNGTDGNDPNLTVVVVVVMMMMMIGVGFEALTMVTIKSKVFWVVTLCSSETVRHFGGTYRLHFQGRKAK
jgi:hypothetical protein